MTDPFPNKLISPPAVRSRVIDKRDLSEAIRPTVPADATVLSVQIQRGAICIWYETTDLAEGESALPERTVVIQGTGRLVPSARDFAYAGTVQQPPFVWHIYVENDAHTKELDARHDEFMQMMGMRQP